MKPEDFKISHCPSGKVQYLHIENGNKRDDIFNAAKSGKMSMEEFKKEQEKMRKGNYLKYIYSESDYLKEIQNE